MIGEINRDFYCLADKVANNGLVNYCLLKGSLIDLLDHCKKCKHCHRKWPTPEQFVEKYSYEWPNDAAVYVFNNRAYSEGYPTKWEVKEYGGKSKWSTYGNHYTIVCASTPWGIPDKDWRSQ